MSTAPISEGEPHAADAKELLEQIIEESQARGVAGQTIAGLALGATEQTIEKVRMLVEASIKMTSPEDWVIYPTRDGKRLGYLQEVGCERIRPYWGISFGRLDLRKDVLEEEVGDEHGNLQFLCALDGSCEATGETSNELGARRTSDGLFKQAWIDAKDTPADRAKLKVDVRKSALANARGRMIRYFTGMNSMPVDVLSKHGLDVTRCRGVEFQEGTRGGSGNLASEPQRRKIAGLVCIEGKVKGFKRENFNRVVAMVGEGQANLDRRAASAVIEWLTKEVQQPIEAGVFYERIGYRPEGPVRSSPARKGAKGGGGGKRSGEAEPSLPSEGLTAEQQTEVLDALEERATAFPDRDPKEIFPLLLKGLLKQLGAEDLTQVSDFRKALTGARNARLPEEA